MTVLCFYKVVHFKTLDPMTYQQKKTKLAKNKEL